MKNKLGDLNNYCSAALERLCDESLTRDQIDQEAKRADAIAAVAAKIIINAGTQLQAAKLWAGHGSAMPMLPKVGGGAADIEGKAE